MHWLNIHTATLDGPEFLGADPVDRATWLCLLRFCAGQEDGGVIRGAAAWKDRQWQQVVRVTLAEVERESALWTWSGDDLEVFAYPAEKESQVRAKRANGAKGGRPKKRPKTTDKTDKKPHGLHTENQQANQQETSEETKPESYAETEGKGRERKGMEWNGSRPVGRLRAETDRLPPDRPTLAALRAAGVVVPQDERQDFEVLIDRYPSLILPAIRACKAQRAQLYERGQCKSLKVYFSDLSAEVLRLAAEDDQRAETA